MKQKLIELQGETDKSMYRNYNSSYLLMNSTSKKLVVP